MFNNKRIKELEDRCYDLNARLKIIERENEDIKSNEKIKELNGKYNINLKIEFNLKLVGFSLYEYYDIFDNNIIIMGELKNPNKIIMQWDFENKIKAYLYDKNKKQEMFDKISVNISNAMKSLDIGQKSKIKPVKKEKKNEKNK